MESSSFSTDLHNINLGNNSSKRKRPNRKKILEEKKANSDLIRAATLKKDHLSSVPAFHRFHRNGLSVHLESGSGNKLSSSLKRDLQNLLKHNMERHYGHEWVVEEKVKRREMVAPEARYILVYETFNLNDNDKNLVGFVHYRFTLEEELPVLYVYEIQLCSRVQGKGLGKLLMQLIEIIAHKSCMKAVVLTVQKANFAAMDFYTTKLSYNISSNSPSLMGISESYEILYKALDNEAKAILLEDLNT